MLTKCQKSFCVPLLTLFLAAALALPASAQKVDITNLTSDISAASPNLDSDLVNPWGMSISPTGPWWLSDNGTGLSTLYNASGQNQGLIVTIPSFNGQGTGSPSGTVYNASSTDFKINGQATPFLFCTEDGTISGWYGGTTAFIAVNNGSRGAVYKGMAIASAAGHNYLYVTNFNAGTVEAYDGTFTTHSFGSGAFVDTTIPSGFAPFNVQNIGNNTLVVTYAKQDAQKHDDVAGPGNGYVDVYNSEGTLQFRLQHVIYLDSPWGVAVAPQSFLGYPGELLIGNFGSGLITAYNASTGVWLGNMINSQDLQVEIPGLWGLTFGNGGSGGPTSTLFFTAGPYGENHGIFGMITPHPGF
jgi:uncharacterized protein (TIGR03118 family)